MKRFFTLLIIITQISYLNFLLIESPKKNNLKKTEEEVDELSNDIIILHLNDVHCGLNDSIGYDGFVLYRDELKKKYKTVLTVDVGDHIQGGTLGAITEGGAILAVMNEVNFDVNTLGNHEFDYGVERLVEINENKTNKYICSNFRKANESTSFFLPYQIVEANNKTIGFIGVVTPLTFTKTYLCTLKDENGNYIYDFYSDKNEFYNVVQENIDKVKNEEGADYVILLTHIGMDVEDFSSNDLLAHLENVNLILDGHSHKVYTVTSKDKYDNDIYLAQAGTKLAYIGQITISEKGEVTAETIREVPRPADGADYIKINRGGKDRYVSKSMNEFLNSIWEEHRDELFLEVGYIDFDMIIRSEKDIDSVCKLRECNLGDLVTDSFKGVVSAEIAMVNGGAIRNGLLKGKITRQKLVDVMPYFNSVFVKEVNGSSILDALEFGVSKLPLPFAGFPQVSGITFDVDTSINSTVVTDPNGMFIRVEGERRVSNVKINGIDLDPSKYYNLSSSEYVLSGGDGYSMFSTFKTINESIFADSDALQYYIKNDLDGLVPEKYKKVDERINIDKPDEKINNSSYIKGNLLFLLLLISFFA